MEFDAFTSRLGFGQGRIRPTTIPAGAGEYAFVLGDDEPGRFFDVSTGDHAEVTQVVDLTDVDLVRAHLVLRIPVMSVPELVWEASILVDGVKLARASAKPGRTRELTDLAANVSKFTGSHTLGVRLELVGA